MKNYQRNLERHHLQRTMKEKMEQAERAVLEMLAKEHENNLARIQSKKQQTEQALAKLTVTAEDIRQYFLIEEKISRESNALDCTEEADTIRALLKKDRLTTEETQALKDAADKIGEAALRIVRVLDEQLHITPLFRSCAFYYAVRTPQNQAPERKTSGIFDACRQKISDPARRQAILRAPSFWSSLFFESTV